MDVRDVWERYRVLHVDSNPAFLEQFLKTYQSTFDITSVQDSTEALNLLSSTPFDVLLVDTRQPGEHLQHLQQLEKDHPDSPVILYTGEQDAHTAFISGDIEYFAREFICEDNREDFILAVKRAVIKKRENENCRVQTDQLRLTGFDSATYKVLGFTTEEVLNHRFGNFISSQFHASLQKQPINDDTKGEHQDMRSGFIDSSSTTFMPDVKESSFNQRKIEESQSYPVVRRRRKRRDPRIKRYNQGTAREDNRVKETPEVLFRAVHDIIPTPIIVLDLEGTIVSVNRAWGSFVASFGRVGDNFGIGSKYQDFWEAISSDKDYLEELNLKLQEIFEGQRERGLAECRICEGDERRWLLVKIHRFMHEGVWRVTIAHENITDRKRREEDLLRQNKELDDFAFRISHDLKNPLSLVIGYLGAIREEPELYNTYYDRVLALSDKMETLINNLLQLCRAGRVLNERSPIDLTTLIRTIFTFTKPADVMASLVFTSELPAVNGDAQAIELVFGNLLDNAFKYRDKDKEMLVIKVGCERKCGEVVISLGDNGSGIPRNMLYKVFEAGFTLRQDEGTGFGLSIARKIIEAHGGSITAESTGVGMGTTFKINLPL